jgi:hypothetical protein
MCQHERSMQRHLVCFRCQDQSDCVVLPLLTFLLLAGAERGECVQVGSESPLLVMEHTFGGVAYCNPSARPKHRQPSPCSNSSWLDSHRPLKGTLGASALFLSWWSSGHTPDRGGIHDSKTALKGVCSVGLYVHLLDQPTLSSAHRNPTESPESPTSLVGPRRTRPFES